MSLLLNRPFLVFLLILPASFSFAQLTKEKEQGPSLECKYIFPIEQVYLSQHINKTQRELLEPKVIDQYIKSLDPLKMYLLQSDADKITEMLKGVLEKTKSAKCDVLFAVQKLFVEKAKDRAQFAKSLLGKDYKFDSKTEFVFDPQKKPFFKTKAELDSFFVKYVHFQISNYLATDMKLAEAKENVIKGWDRQIKRVNEIKNDDVLAMYLNSFSNALDPHSAFFAKDSNEDFRIQMSLSLEGIGATLSSQDGFTVIEALVPGGAAARSGQLKPQDKIMAVAQGEKGAMDNVIEMELRDVVRKIRGPKGSKVRLLILRKEGEGKTRQEVTLTREQIKLEDEAATIHYIDRNNQKIGIIELPSFYADGRRTGRSCAADVKKLIAEAKEKKVDALVFDLSMNGGGSLEDAVKIGGLFIGTGNIVKQSSREGGRGEATLRDIDPTVDWSGPMVVLTSRMSASASEIVAGSLKDYKRALIVGSDHTFGKGTVQTVIGIPPNSEDLGAVKVTVGMFYTSGGFSTQHRGVEADIKIPSAYDLDEVGEKSLDYSLPPSQVPPFLSAEANPNQAWKPITPDAIKAISERSKLRVAASEDFKKIIDELNKTKEKGKIIRLSEASKDKEKKEKARAIKNAGKDEKEKEYFKRADIQEAINAVSDLMTLQKGLPLAALALDKTEKADKKEKTQ
jgi:carboxyl-terminal processing protease